VTLRRLLPTVVIGVMVAVLLPVPPAGAAPGARDPRFDGDGVATAFLSGSGATAVVIDRLGRIVVAGSTTDGDVGLARFLPRGVLDPTFGTGGRLLIDLGGVDEAFALALAPDGGLAVAGRTTVAGASSMFVLRLDAAGAPVATFGTGGVATVTFGWRLQGANAVRFDRTGRIVAAGYTSNGAAIRSALVRLRADGTPDPAFGDDGRVTLDVSAGGETVNGLIVLPGGRIVAAGTADVGLEPRFDLFRLNANGTRDTTFGTSGGITRTDVGGAGVGNAIARTPDGHLVVAGQAGDGWGIARYGGGGRLDPGFGAGGVVALPFTPGFDQALGVAAAGSALIVVGRIRSAATGDDAGIVRLRTTGALDPTFGTGGVVRLDLAHGTDVARSVALQRNGKIVIAGTGTRGGVPRFLVARLLAR